MKVTFKTVQGTQFQLEIDASKTVRSRTSQATTLDRRCPGLVSSRPWRLQGWGDLTIGFFRNLTVAGRLQVEEVKAEVEKSQGAAFAAASQKIIYQGKVGEGLITLRSQHSVLHLPL